MQTARLAASKAFGAARDGHLREIDAYQPATVGRVAEFFLRQDFVKTAHAKGLHPWRVTVRHVLRNALMPLTTIVGMHFGTLLGGAAATETVFNWPGLGRLALDAVLARDFSVLLGVLLLSSLLVIVANGVVDLLQAWLDPRVA